MRESIHKYLQVGTLLWMSYPRTDALEAAKSIAKDDYFDALELSHIADDGKRAEIAKALSQSHLNVLYGEHPTLLSQGLIRTAVEEAKRLAREKNISVLASLHDLNQALYFGDQFFFMKDGVIKYAGGKEIVTEEIIRDVFDIAVKIVQVENQTIILGGYYNER